MDFFCKKLLIYSYKFFFNRDLNEGILISGRGCNDLHYLVSILIIDI